MPVEGKVVLILVHIVPSIIVGTDHVSLRRMKLCAAMTRVDKRTDKAWEGLDLTILTANILGFHVLIHSADNKGFRECLENAVLDEKSASRIDSHLIVQCEVMQVPSLYLHIVHIDQCLFFGGKG